MKKARNDQFFSNLEKFVKRNEGAKKFIAGKQLGFLTRNMHRRKFLIYKFKEMSSVHGIELPQDFFNDFAWVQGGAGYVLSRDLVTKITSQKHERLFKFNPMRDKHIRPWLVSEDFIVALSSYLEGGKVKHSDLFINQRSHLNDISPDEVISMHRCDSSQMEVIHGNRLKQARNNENNIQP